MGMIKQWFVEVSIRVKDDSSFALKDMPVGALLDVSRNLEELTPGRKADGGMGFGARDLQWYGMSEREALEQKMLVEEFAKHNPKFSFEVNMGKYEEDVEE